MDLIVLLVLILLFLLSLKFKVFSRKGNVAALIVGAAIGLGGNLSWLLLMVIFAVTSFIATKAFFKQKEASRLQEGKHGERSSSNIIYAGIIGVVLALLNFFKIYWIYDYGDFFLLFAVSFSVINSDTFASEIGVIDKNVIMITNFRKTEPGVNGGISLLGSLASLVGGAHHRNNIHSVLLLVLRRCCCGVHHDHGFRGFQRGQRVRGHT